MPNAIETAKNMTEDQLKSEFERLYRKLTETGTEEGDAEQYGEVLQQLNNRGWRPEFKTIVQWGRMNPFEAGSLLRGTDDTIK